VTPEDKVKCIAEISAVIGWLEGVILGCEFNQVDFKHCDTFRRHAKQLKKTAERIVK